MKKTRNGLLHLSMLGSFLFFLSRTNDVSPHPDKQTNNSNSKGHTATETHEKPFAINNIFIPFYLAFCFNQIRFQLFTLENRIDVVHPVDTTRSDLRHT